MLSVVNWLEVCPFHIRNNSYILTSNPLLQRANNPSEEQSNFLGASVMELLSGDNGESTFNGKWPCVDEDNISRLMIK